MRTVASEAYARTSSGNATMNRLALEPHIDDVAELPVPSPLPFDSSELCAPRGNRILARLPPNDFKRLQKHLQPAWLLGGDKLHDGGGEMFAAFPVQSVLSLQSPHADGCSVSFASIGHEGCFGFQLLGHKAPAMQAVAAIGGLTYLLPVEQLREEFERQGAFAALLVEQGQQLLAQAGILCGCHRRHALEQQLASWLLLTLARMRGNELIVTQEMISSLLGVRREGITEAARKLQKLGLIEYRRGHIYILQPGCLAARACECYPAIRQQLQRGFER